MQLRAIVIDDNEACRSLLEMILSSRGYNVICLPDPTACLLYENLQCSCPPDAVCGDFLLTDNQMPYMSGLELIARQARGGCKGLMRNKAIFSGTWCQDELQKARQLGCKIFSKPYRREEIESWLDAQEKDIPSDRKLVDLGSLMPGNEFVYDEKQ